MIVVIDEEILYILYTHLRFDFLYTGSYYCTSGSEDSLTNIGIRITWMARGSKCDHMESTNTKTVCVFYGNFYIPAYIFS